MKKFNRFINPALTVLVAVTLAGSGVVKISGTAAAQEMAEGLSVGPGTIVGIGIVEIVSVILFLIPRTAILGTFMLAAYMGGAIAAHIVHGESFLFPAIVQALVWIVAFLRFPELRQRILHGQTAH